MRTDFSELLHRKDQRFRYTFEKLLPDEDSWKEGGQYTLELNLYNCTTRQNETICVRIDTVRRFPGIRHCQFVGYAVSDDASFRVRVDGYLYYSRHFESYCDAYAVPPRLEPRLSAAGSDDRS